MTDKLLASIQTCLMTAVVIIWIVAICWSITPDDNKEELGITVEEYREKYVKKLPKVPKSEFDKSYGGRK